MWINEYVIFNKEKLISPVYSKNIQEYEKIFFATLFRLENNHNQPFVQNACKNFDFSQQPKFAKYFAKISAVNRVRGLLANNNFFIISLLLL